jgi:ubiquinone biosynthesis O-methyltransferase
MAIFDNSASDYDAWYTDKKGSFVDMVETDLAFELLKVKKGMKILDMGCGTGNFSIKLAEKGCHVTGADISDEMLKIARKKASKLNHEIEFFNMDLKSLSFEDDTFDVVLSMSAFEFVDDPPKALQELLRVTKKDGQVLIGTIAGNSSWSRLYHSENFRNTVFKHAKFITLEEIKSWNSEKLADWGECLFVSPLDNEDYFNYETENNLSKTTNGGFICALWKK